MTNGVYDLLYTTNLSSPVSWQWVMRTDPGQTNLVVTNAVDMQGFYRLGPPNDLIANDSLGTNFWMAFMSMQEPGDPPYNMVCSLHISGTMATTGAVTIPSFGITNTFTLAAGGVTNIILTNSVMIPYYYSDTNLNQGINVTSSAPVSVYATKYESQDSAVFTCYPTPLLGTNYCLMARAPYDGDGQSEFAIVATAAGTTTIKITPSANAYLVSSDGYNDYTSTYTNVMQQGQAYQIYSDGYDFVNSEVTGTWIASDKPVALFAGASVALVPDANTDAGNPLVQEQLSVEVWGTQALCMGFAGRTNGDSYRILAAYNNTVVWTNGVVAGTNQAGGFLDLIIAGPVQFKAGKPIQVAHFANGTYFDDASSVENLHEGDPAEILLLPTGHYLETNVVIALPNDNVTGDFDENFMNLIVPQSATNATFIDGSLVSATNFVAMGTSGYYGAQLTVTNGTHKVISSQPIGVEVYGWGEFDAYGYFGGIVK